MTRVRATWRPRQPGRRVMAALFPCVVLLLSCGPAVRREPAHLRRPVTPGQPPPGPVHRAAPRNPTQDASRAVPRATARKPPGSSRRAGINDRSRASRSPPPGRSRAPRPAAVLPTTPTPSREPAQGPFDYAHLRDGRFGGILQGVGPLWERDEMRAYRRAFPDLPPAVQRLGINLAPSPRASFTQRFDELAAKLAEFPLALPALTLKFDTPVDKQNGRGLERELISGQFDSELTQLARLLGELDRPSFLRIGPEVNGPWNGYTPGLFPLAFREVVEHFRREGATRTVFLWNVKLQAEQPRPVLDWYPGDEWVDWWSIDLFAEDFADPVVAARVRDFLGEAARRGKPVMIPESCPSGLELDEPATWRDWFAPYFELINGDPGVKAFLYSNRDFRTRDVRLTHWGDMRIEHSALAPIWRMELGGPQYVNQTHFSRHW